MRSSNQCAHKNTQKSVQNKRRLFVCVGSMLCACANVCLESLSVAFMPDHIVRSTRFAHCGGALLSDDGADVVMERYIGVAVCGLVEWPPRALWSLVWFMEWACFSLTLLLLFCGGRGDYQFLLTSHIHLALCFVRVNDARFTRRLMSRMGLVVFMLRVVVACVIKGTHTQNAL